MTENNKKDKRIILNKIAYGKKVGKPFLHADGYYLSNKSWIKDIIIRLKEKYNDDYDDIFENADEETLKALKYLQWKTINDNQKIIPEYKPPPHATSGKKYVTDPQTLVITKMTWNAGDPVSDVDGNEIVYTNVSRALLNRKLKNQEYSKKQYERKKASGEIVLKGEYKKREIKPKYSIKNARATYAKVLEEAGEELPKYLKNFKTKDNTDNSEEENQIIE